MTDDSKQSKNTPDDPWARFDELDRESIKGSRDLDPLDDDLGDEDWELDDELEDELDDELFDDEVEAPAPRDVLLADKPLTASKDDDLDFGADDTDDDLEFDEDEYLDDDDLNDDGSDYPLEDSEPYRAAADVLQPRTPADLGSAATLAAASAASAASANIGDRNGGSRKLAKPARNLPWIPLVAGVVAIVLVLAGGFGMVQQRNELQAEIRELRARLATAPSADALAAAKADQESLRAQNTELSTAYGALQQEAERLQSAISELRTAQEAAQKASQSARAAAAKPAATAPAVQASAPRATAPTGGSWFVNFAAYRDEATAKRWADRLKVSGGKVEVQPISSDGRPLYRVRVSQIASRTEATRIARALEQEHNVSSLWVGQQ